MGEPGVLSLVPVVPVVLGLLALVSVLAWPSASASARDRPAAESPHGAATGGRLVLLLSRGRARWEGAGARGREEVALLEGLAAALEAGLPTHQAVAVLLEAHGPVGASSWEPLALAATRGQPLAPAWARVARWSGSPTVASVARAWVVASATGAPLAAAVRCSASAGRERHRLRQAVRTATAGARATVLVLSLLPLAGLAMAAAIGVGPVGLYGDPVALAAALVGLTLLGVGHLVVRRMVGRVLKGLA